MLRNFGKLAETLRNDPLLLATTDALYGAEEELARAWERTKRQGSPGAPLTKREEDVLDFLLRRSDALGNAYTALLDSGRGSAKELEDLQWVCDDATEHFTRYKLEWGLSDE